MAPVDTVVGLRNVPDAVRSLSTLTEPDYVDLFTVGTTRASAHGPEQWARIVLERTPLARRRARLLWSALGLRLGPAGSPDHIQGWTIGDRGDDWIRIETDSWWAAAQAVLRAGGESVSIALFIRYRHPLASALWQPVAVAHRRAVPVMLRQAVILAEDGPSSDRR